MKCMTMQSRMYELGIAGSRSRPGVSNNDPYSESLFRTLIYCSRWPSEGFESLEAARIWVVEFVRWYNLEHLHSRIKFVTPDQRHRGVGKQILIELQKLYESMRAQNPNRWLGCARNWTVQGSVELTPEQKKDVA
jgi:GNAT superfamily N-acetyltransferase